MEVATGILKLFRLGPNFPYSGVGGEESKVTSVIHSTCVYLRVSNHVFVCFVCLLIRSHQVRSLFRMDFDEMVRTWAHFHYDWLPAYEAVPKVIGAQLVPRQLDSLEVKLFILIEDK